MSFPDPEYNRDQRNIKQPWSKEDSCKGDPSIGTGCGYCSRCKDWFSRQPNPEQAERSYTRNRMPPTSTEEKKKTPQDLLKRFKEIRNELASYEELFGVGSNLAEEYCGKNDANLGRAQECLTVAKFAIDNLINYGHEYVRRCTNN